MALTAAKIEAFVTERGMNATFTVPGTRSYNPATGVWSDGTTSEVVEKTSPPFEDVSQFTDDLDLRQQAAAAIILPSSGLTFTPAEGMKVVIGGDTFKIMRITHYRLGDGSGTSAAYLLYLGSIRSV